jgi:SAM-dependent methyltransferase
MRDHRQKWPDRWTRAAHASGILDRHGAPTVGVARCDGRTARLFSRSEDSTMTAVAPSPSTPAPDLAAIKAKQQVAWGTGNYAVVGTTLQIVGEQLCEALDLRAGQTVLDVAAGNGNATLAAARRWCQVTSTDYVPSLLESGRARATADGYDIVFREADAEALPFADGSFDVVMSTFGVMFTPNHAQAASELVRVCRVGGKIGLANWTPDSFIGQLFKTIGRFVPPAAGIRSPSLWGNVTHLEELFAGQVKSIRATERQFTFRYRSPLHWIEVFRTYYGPMHRTFAALDATQQAAFTEALLQLMEAGNVSGDETLVLPSAYLEVVIEH